MKPTARTRVGSTTSAFKRPLKKVIRNKPSQSNTPRPRVSILGKRKAVTPVVVIDLTTPCGPSTTTTTTKDKSSSAIVKTPPSSSLSPSVDLTCHETFDIGEVRRNAVALSTDSKLSVASATATASTQKSTIPIEPLFSTIKMHTTMDLDPDLVHYMLDAEKTYHMDPNYMLVQTAINVEMRAILMDWMMEVGRDFALTRETVHLALNYVDRFCAREMMLVYGPNGLLLSKSQAPITRLESEAAIHAKRMRRENYQCIGVTCLQIAAKFEEMFPPKTSDFSEATGDSCTEAAISSAELDVLKGLNYRLSAQTPYSWLRLFIKLIVIATTQNRSRNATQTTTTTTTTTHDDVLREVGRDPFIVTLLSNVTFYRLTTLLDTVALDNLSLSYFPSELAAATLCVVLGKPASDLMFCVSGYSSSQLVDSIALFKTYDTLLSKTDVFSPKADATPEVRIHLACTFDLMLYFLLSGIRTGDHTAMQKPLIT